MVSRGMLFSQILSSRLFVGFYRTCSFLFLFCFALFFFLQWQLFLNCVTRAREVLFFFFDWKAVVGSRLSDKQTFVNSEDSLFCSLCAISCGMFSTFHKITVELQEQHK